MSYIKSTYASGAAYLAALASDILPSNDWSVFKNSGGEMVFGMPAGQGGIGFIVTGSDCEIQGFPVYDPAVSVRAQAGSYQYAALTTPSLPRFRLPVGEVTVWTLVNARRFCAVIKSGSTYWSFYAGLFLPFSSNLKYPFPCFVGGSGQLDTASQQSAYPFFSGGIQRCPKICLPDGEWQEVGGSGGGGTSFPNSFPYSYSYAYIWPFDGKFSKLGKMLDGAIMVYPAMIVGSNASLGDDGAWLGYLDGVVCLPVGLAAESIVTVDGLDYLVVPNVAKTSENYGLRLS